MSFIATVQRFVSDWTEARRFARTEQLLASMTAELRKDIGWPTRHRVLRERPAR